MAKNNKNHKINVHNIIKELRKFIEEEIIPIASTFPKKHVTVTKEFCGNKFSFTIANDLYDKKNDCSLLICKVENENDIISQLISSHSSIIYNNLIGVIERRERRRNRALSLAYKLLKERKLTA